MRRPRRVRPAPPEPREQPQRRRQGLRRRGFEPAESGEVGLSPGQQLQRRPGEVDPGDLGRLVGRPGCLLARRPEPQAESRALAAGPPGALVGGGAADPRQLQPVDAGGRVVAQAPRQAAVHHRGDAFDGDRALGDVGGQHHPAPVRRPQHVVLPLRRQVAVERQHREVVPRGEIGQGVGGAQDLAHSRQEGQHVACR
ncbi:MAG TPA: hypothetical protein VHB47_04145, partial [Thermoanaerobaculia bacterium]|nr:hypothetical protein [Thermoanaerobaculia bacterium]